jgi:hypothetical protein
MRNISAVAACRSSASFNSRVNRATSVSWPPSEEVLCAAGAARRFDTLLLRRLTLAGWLPALERGRNVTPKAQSFVPLAYTTRLQQGFSIGEMGSTVILQGNKLERPMSALGQKRT